ncbi:ribokinase [Bifidobacterium aemilianum]|uniref:Ribokinase n=1 Tax=Bifidobacterium aemilianum TaxID=2493120 RepID=A0A366K9W3_9BIFI|nr:PfkB family carbohydrate kinase [Bifidobacterium aemilianum]RBP97913.1 ribokinase [Bifidobacterium aemilianum]
MKITDIANMAGVSTSTVSKIVNGKDSGISEETRNKVLTIVRQYHYTPYASSSKSMRTWTIAVLLRSPISFDSTLDGIVQKAQANGYSILTFNSYSSSEQEKQNIAAINRHNVDGIIWEPVSNESHARGLELDGKEPPILIIGPHGGDQSLLLPYKDAAYRLTEELINQGHKRIGCLITQGRRTEEFLHGFKSCLFDHSVPYQDDLTYYELNDDLIDRIRRGELTGFIASHYRKALAFSQLAKSLHYRIPSDLSLVSLKNDDKEALTYPGGIEISTYTMRNSDFGSYLCGKLIAAIEHKEESQASFVQDFMLDNLTTLGRPAPPHLQSMVVVGSINIDTYMKVPELPHEGATVTTNSAIRSPGGKGINQAVGAAKLGHQVSLIGNVGADEGADLVFKELVRWGIDSSGITRCPQQATGKALIFVDPNGESMISILSEANATLDTDSILRQEHLFEHCGYCLIQSEIPLEVVGAAARTAHHHQAKTILKPSSINHIPNAILKDIDILVPNLNELDIIQPGDDSMEEKARKLLERGAGCMVVTMGEEGAYLRTPSCERYYPAENFSAVDNTGAGDAFISALASYLMRGYDIEEAVSIANYAAGSSISHRGVIGSLIDRLTLDTHTNRMNLNE